VKKSGFFFFWISVGDGKERGSPGSVGLMRREGFNEPTSRARCLVYDHAEIRKIVLGAQFLERRKHYRGGANDMDVEEKVDIPQLFIEEKWAAWFCDA
jgi:hypothetical protein